MPVAMLTTVSPAPAGFATAVLSKRVLLDGTVVVLVRDLAEILAVLPDARARMRGLVLSAAGRSAWQRLGPSLWHWWLPEASLPLLADTLPGLVATIEDGFVSAELAHSRAIELERTRADLAAMRRDYHESVNHLSESEERFRALVETSRDWIWATDTQGHYVYCSPRVRDLLGYEPQEMVGRDFYALMPPEEAARVRILHEEIVRERRPLVNFENVNRHRDGRLVILETSAMPILDSQGGWHGYRGIDRDITARRRAEEDRLQLERRILHSQKLESLGVLAGGIAHDFNNLLVTVLGNAELALMDMADDAAGRDAVVDIRRATLRASELTNQMLAYSGKGRFVVEPVDLSALVGEMGRLLEVTITKRARISYDLASDLPLIEADAAQIRQIVMNLVTNASEAIETAQRDGVIILRTSLRHIDAPGKGDDPLGDALPAGRYAAVEIADTGCGMTRTVQARLFDPFFTTKFLGRGLGMAVVQGIVRGHRGGLDIHSEPNMGTSITVLLPVGAEIAELPVEQPQSRTATWRSSGTVLVVDDDRDVRGLTERILERLGFTVITADDGAAGVARFGEHQADVSIVLLDLTMPVMGGEQAFLELQRLRPDVPVVLMSGYTEQDATSRFTGLKLAGFLKKPFTIDELIAAVRIASNERDAAP
jgi:two-component system, cell cycle sensor histidine kinase and response regulator CckA